MSWILALLGFSALIVLHEFGHFAVAKLVGMRVERFALFFPPLLFKVKRGETEYGVGSIPLGGYVRITGMNPNEELAPEVAPRAYYAQPVWKRVAVITAGPAMNVLLAFAILFTLYVVKGTYDTDRPEVAAVGESAPAAGKLKTGDEILTVDGKGGSVTAITNAIAAHGCAGGAKVQGCRAATAATFVVKRDGKPVTLKIVPEYDARTKPAKMRVGFGVGAVREPRNVVQASGDSLSTMWDVTHLTVTAIAKLFYSEKARSEVSGVVGNYEVTRQTIERSGFEQTMIVLALISLSLAIVNLFPFLPLDGGHIFWAVVEKLRGRAVSISVMERASVIGFGLVLILFAIGLVNDIGRITGDGFGVR